MTAHIVIAFTIATVLVAICGLIYDAADQGGKVKPDADIEPGDWDNGLVTSSVVYRRT